MSYPNISAGKPKAPGAKARNYVPKILFTYASGHLDNTKKVSFFYALKGRYGKDGVIKKYNVNQLAKSVLVVPIEHESSVESFLKQWGCSYTKQEVLVAG